MEIDMSGRWGVPATGIVLGVLLFGGAAVGGQPTLGAGMFAVMAIYTFLVIAFRGRNETVGILGGVPADERLAAFNVTATAIAGLVAILVSIGGFLVAIAQGRDGNEYAVVAASAGLAYLAALAWLQWRG